MNTISNFRGKYFFLSNFYPARIKYGIYTFLNNEAAFQAMKCPDRANEFCLLDPSEAKKLGRKVQLRKDWEEVKELVMYEICYHKFNQNSDICRMLLDTGNAELIEGNTWGDIIWGVCNGVGENLLGKILMRIRNEMNDLRR